MADAQKHVGGCHCGKVRYEVTTDIGKVFACNCSICARKGWLLTFVEPEQFKLLSGEEAVSDYQFNKHNIHHFFCATCGVSSFSRGTGPGGGTMYSINVRCLEDVDLGALTVVQLDGKSR
jgi:hypothetical protein